MSDLQVADFYGRARYELVVHDDWVSVPHESSIDGSLTAGLSRRDMLKIWDARKTFNAMRRWVVIDPALRWVAE